MKAIKGIKVFQVDACTWVAAKTAKQAVEYATTIDGWELDETYNPPEEMSDADMDKYTFQDDVYPKTKLSKRTFREQLQKQIDAGEGFPDFFATSEF